MYDLTTLPDKLIGTTKESGELEVALEESSFVRDQMKYIYETSFAKEFTVAKNKGMSVEQAKSEAILATGAEQENLIEAEYRYKLCRANFNDSERKLMTIRQLSKLNEKDL